METEKLLDDSQEEVVALEQEVETDENLEELPTEDEVELTDTPEKPKQTKEANAIAAAARREAEAAAKAAKEKAAEAEAKYQELKASLTTVYKPMSDERKKQLEREAEEKGKDPDDYIEMIENREFRESVKAEKALKAAEEQRKETAVKRAEADIREFETVTGKKFEELKGNELFMRMNKNRFGVDPMIEIAKDWETLTGGAKAVESVKSKNERSTGAGGTVESGLTVEQRRRLADWNKRNPDLKMTAKDFFT